MVCLAEERAKPPSETLPPKRKPPSVADVLRRYGPILLQQSVKELTDYQERALRELMDCRTAALGGQSWQCNTCGERHFRFHSCRNRFCPTCSGSARAAWLAAMLQKKLPIGYAHVVFTLPRALSLLAIANPKVAYNLLFDAAWKAMDRAARRLGMKLGAVMTLHTWGQRMLPHPHS